MATIKDIYRTAIKTANLIDSWRETGFILDGDNVAHNAVLRECVRANNEIVPGVALSFTCAVAQALLFNEDSKELQAYIDNDHIVLAETLKTEYAVYIANGC